MSDLQLTFATQQDWEDWLEQHGADASVVWLRLAKKGAPQPTLSYAQALEAALCFGWIDGQKKTDDAHHWLQRFTPRRARSIWSQINKDKAQALLDAGRMRQAGQREIALAQQDGRWDAAYTSARNSTVPDDLQSALDANPAAAACFATLNGANRFAILFRLQNAKKPETRSRKLGEFIDMLARGERLHP
ncbi:hypothetical protein IGB42_01827 [Andreprevotia sp. IGB-42]|uniref:YdeI/OmpD-associated family protein n=1 Tax=Andreprevotia sp. IGB-42 TaxID=2497473 RepID=UPI001359DF1E|nr:YdeI/OmpD-associated family protein [Andreprevotia sp. IGB-42]KAF0813476.1 hypothetical protein IGB42_01827 [Andreprevotia sp. IGB-42]